MSTDEPDNLIERAAADIASSERLLVLTGAGVSRESGVPTFRDALEGLWAKHDPLQLATPEGYSRNPKLVWDWYVYRRKLIEGCIPNPAHQGLAQFDDLLPQCVIATQNVDGLHQMAGSMDVIEMHGNIRTYRCSALCTDGIYEIPDFAKETEAPPACPNCGALLRPNVVWFGEPLPYPALQRATELAEDCDVMLIIGTSGLVNPAAMLPRIAKAGGAVLIDINPESDEFTAFVDYALRGKASQVVPKIVDVVRRRA